MFQRTDKKGTCDMSLQTEPDRRSQQDKPLLPDLIQAARYYLTRRRTLIVGALAIVAGGMALNWGWLVAAGFAPLILGFLPCAAMCALGMCMNHGKGDGHKGGGCCPPGNDESGPDDRRS